MAQRGTVIGLALWLAAGCSDSKSEQDAAGGAAAISGQRGGGSGGVGADSGGPFGAGGARAGGSGTGGDAASKACMELPQPGVFACVLGDGIPYPGTGVASVDITGTVARAEADRCATQAGSRTFGDILGEGAQAYLIDDGEMEIALTLRTGSDKPLLTVGQRVRLTIEEVANSGFARRDNITISVRGAGGELLYWFAQTDLGADQLELPDGFSARDGDLQCMHDWDCATRFRRHLMLRYGSDEVAIEIGEVAELGDLTALVLDNSEIVPGTNGTCFDLVVHTTRRVAFFARDLVSKCDWLDESGCAGDDCRAVRAYVGDFNPQPTFVACVEDGSCTDGDVVTCASNDETGQLADFTSTCVPPGWTVAHDACDVSDDAGAP